LDSGRVDDGDSAGGCLSANVGVRAYHAAEIIDVGAILSDVLGSGTPRVEGKTGVVVEIPIKSSRTHPDATSSSMDRPLPKFVSVYRFGSVVFFNFNEKEAQKMLKDIKNHPATKDAVSSGFEIREDYEVALMPEMCERAYANGDYATVPDVDANIAAVISEVMAHTVAIDYYSDTVDELLATFAVINASVQRTGSFTDMERENLFRVVARNNSLLIDMVSGLGIKDRSDTAWTYSKYEGVWEDMKNEFEIDDRFDHIEFKLDLIQSNAKFFLEMLHHQKTNSLEWTIIVLIGCECILMCLDMSGMGGKAFNSFPSLFPPLDLPPTK